MDVALVGVIAAVLGAAIGALIPVFAPEIRLFFLKSGDKALAGEWYGVWTVEASDDAGRIGTEYLDVLEISVRGRIVTGKGCVPQFGHYEISGRDSEFCSVLNFKGTTHSDHLAGVVLIRKNSSIECEGRWWQLGADGTMFGGSLRLERRNP